MQRFASELEKDIQQLVIIDFLKSSLKKTYILIEELRVKNSILFDDYSKKNKEISWLKEVHMDALRKERVIHTSKFTTLKLKKDQEDRRMQILLNEQEARIGELKTSNDYILLQKLILITYILWTEIEKKKFNESIDLLRNEKDADAEEIKEDKHVVARACNQEAMIRDELQHSRKFILATAVVSTSSVILGAGVTASSLYRSSKR